MDESDTGRDRIVTVPNIISVIRLILMLVFGVLVVRGADVAAIVVLGIAASSDWIDGVLARKLNQVTRLGQLLDPAADRLLIMVSVLAMAYREVIPWWLIVVILVREVIVGLLLLVLQRRGHGNGLPVSLVGKTGTFMLMVAFPLLLLAHIVGGEESLLWAAGWAMMWWGIGVYWFAGLTYFRQGSQMLRARHVKPVLEVS
ncbi:CDP-diacylglycerol--glycerol-3-phosphate 3-phosphatidyltransferase [Micrococcales bacterium KH10]|nr:CDP-diacylglycerol--glycerol-3-phosphate 3-phosphatidyltransferase [Micrococcales bacterium KH10]